MPELRQPTRFLDFGSGFYTTTHLEQADRWAQKVARRANTPTWIVSRYDTDIDAEGTGLRVMVFDHADEAWLHFVTENRRGGTAADAFDVIRGPVANDVVFATIQLYEAGLLSFAETLGRLRVENLADQIVFRTKLALDQLHFLDSVAGEGADR